MKNFEADESVVPPGVRVLAAVSSGADSMALLFWLHNLRRDVVVGHVHHDLHELRPGECDADESFVRDKCAALGVPFVSRQVDLPRKNGHVNEVVARDARYSALLEMAHEANCPLVATAHTATDGLETALLNLMRGAGPGGWLGIAPRRSLSEATDLVRPFWKVPREATRQILRDNNWEWREDASNLAPLFRRNRVRAELLPLLADIAGQSADALAIQTVGNAQIARDEAALVQNLAQEALSQLIVKREADLVSLDGEKFGFLHVALQRRVMRLAAQLIVPHARDLSGAKIETARRAASQGGKRAVWMWRNDLSVEWTGAGAGNRLRFWRVKSATEGESAFK